MPDDDDPMEGLGLTPRFRRPPRDPTSLPLDPAQPSPADPDPNPDSTPGLGLGVDAGGAAPARTRTGRSSAGSDPERLALAVAATAALIGMAGLAAAAVVRWRRRGRLRQPTDGQARAIAVPLAAIAARHVPIDWLTDDLVDAVRASEAVGAYLRAGPLIEPDADPGELPQEEPS